MSPETALVLRESLPPALRTALSLWADATTDSSTNRRNDLLRDKQQAVASFFSLRRLPARSSAVGSYGAIASVLGAD